MNDIYDINDIQLFVDEFYEKVRRDDLIGPVFLEVIPGDWRPHLDKMYAFWNAALFGISGYKGNPFAQHAPLIIGREHFDRWLRLFAETIDHHFEGPMAENTKTKAGLMANTFIHRLELVAGNRDKVVF